MKLGRGRSFIFVRPGRASLLSLLRTILLATTVLLMGQALAIGAEESARELHPGARRQDIKAKLDKLEIGSLRFEGMPLTEVLKFLESEVKRLDAAGMELRFILNDTSTNQANSEGLETVTVDMERTLTSVRLIDALEAIVRAADKPIKYSVEDYGVVFSSRKNEVPALFTRIIRVNPGALKSVLESAGGLKGLLANINVDISPPKSIFVKDREGVVLIRATVEELDAIEKALQTLKGPAHPGNEVEKPAGHATVPEIWYPTDPPRKARSP
jgi:hypothetical protein